LKHTEHRCRYTCGVTADKSRQRSTGGTTENGWECLRLKYAADWPLHVLFTTSVLDR